MFPRFKVKNKIAEIAIWAQTTPPYGGISVHIQRLLPILHKNNISYQLYNFQNTPTNNPLVKNYSGKTLLWFIKLFLGRSEKIHYVFSTKAKVRFLSVLFGLVRNRVIIISIHGASLHKNIMNGSIVTRFMAKFSIRNAHVVIGVNDDICKFAIEQGADPGNVFHIPAYIPPKNNGEEPDSEICTFFADKSPRLMITGFLKSRQDGDLYGIWRTIDILPDVINEHPHTGLLIILQNNITLESSLINELKKEIKKRKITEKVMFSVSKTELWPLFKTTDIFLRPTESDGDAVSIREAIHMGTPVVASDCVQRLDVVKTYRSEDEKCYIIALNNVISNIDIYRQRLQNYKINDNSIPLVRIIKSKLI